MGMDYLARTKTSPGDNRVALEYNRCMRRVRRVFMQVLTMAVGLPLLVFGIILIPLPGPGLLVSFLALFILSLGFEWPKKYLEQIKDTFRTIYQKAKERADNIEGSGKER